MEKIPEDIVILKTYMTVIWCMLPQIWSVMDRIFCHFGPYFPFNHACPPNKPKNQNFEKIKKFPGNIILHMCNINDNHMIYGSWDTECLGQNFSSFCTIFCPFTLPPPRKIRKIKIWKKNEKKHLGILSFYTGVP